MTLKIESMATPILSKWKYPYYIRSYVHTLSTSRGIPLSRSLWQYVPALHSYMPPHNLDWFGSIAHSHAADVILYTGSSVRRHLWYNSRVNICIPSIAKIVMKNKRNDTKYPICGRETKSVATKRFILGRTLMLRSGRNTLIVLRDLRFGTFGIKEMSPIITTKKSSTFQGSLR